jgi:hypothetical protein
VPGEGAPGTLPIEWLPAPSPFYGELHLLYAEGLLDTTVGLSFRPKARADVARLVQSAARGAPPRHPGVVRLGREFSREYVLEGLPAEDGYTPPLLSLPDPASVGPEDRAAVRLTLIPYLTAALERQFDGHTRLAHGSSIGFRLGLALGPVLFYQDLFAGRYDGGQRFSDALVHDTDFLLYAEDLYLTWRTRWLDFSFGRARHNLGPGPETTLLHDDAAGTMTHFSYSASLFGGKLAGRAFHGDVDAAAGDRLAEHGLEWTPTPSVQLSIFEAARYSSDQWEPLYVLSLVPYSLVQKMLEQDALGDSTQGDVRNNVIAGLGGRWRFARGHVLYGELLVDDLALEESGVPTRLGYQLGWLWARSLGARRVFAGLEWNHVDRYVYAVDYGEDFIHQEHAIGFPLGPDVGAVALRAGFDPVPEWRLTAAADWVDAGEGTLGEYYDGASPTGSGGAPPDEPARAFLLGGGVLWMPRDGIEVSARAAGQWPQGTAEPVEGFAARVGFTLRR